MSEKRVQLILGLGNPGAEYENTRHNVGAATVATLAKQLDLTFRRHASRCLVAEGRIGTLPGGAPGPKVILALSTTYMNVSGGPYARLANAFSIPPQSILVAHDDLDLPAQTLRLKDGGGTGGHNGLKSLTENLRSKDYLRLRIGIGRPPGSQTPADFVLAQIRSKERTEWDVTYQIGADVIKSVVCDGFIAAQQELHSRQS